MSATSTRVITLGFAGDRVGNPSASAAANTNSPAATAAPITLAIGDNTIIVPTGGSVTKAVTIMKRRAIERCEALANLGPPPPWSRPWKLRRWLRAYRAIMALDIGESAEMLRSLYPNERIAELAHRPNNVIRGIVKAELSRRMVPGSERR